MPKTFTDDVAAAFPSSIDGPLQVVSPSDHDSWIQIDPSGARIGAAGGARPTRTTLIRYARSYGANTPTYMGFVLPARFVAGIATGGYYSAPIMIPDDMDLSAPSSLAVLVAPFVDSSASGATIRLILLETHVEPGTAAHDHTVIYDWEVPDNWTTDDPRRVTIDNGTGVTFAAGTFRQGQHVAFRIARDGSAGNDTFPETVVIADHMVFEYTARTY